LLDLQAGCSSAVGAEALADDFVCDVGTELCPADDARESAESTKAFLGAVDEGTVFVGDVLLASLCREMQDC
jgi:hypothetical protein